MARSGPIVLVDDDEDDRDFIIDVLKELDIPNPVLYFNDCAPALRYLKETQDSPFLIISDVNLPKQTGLEFKRSIDTDPQLRQKSIPFVFLSTSVRQQDVNEAYSQMTTQGFFQKKAKLEELKKVIRIIFDYWEHCFHPNT
ncbi:MAG TPA: response regulator [Chitinophagaceae bacterium]|jgi:CheY-like chemotaxis protein|nr:response regulator [Chitinophagaceae bacterium]